MPGAVHLDDLTAPAGVPSGDRRRRRAGWIMAFALPPILGLPWLGALRPWFGGEPPLAWTFSGLVAALLLAASAVTDLRRGKIYNWATYPALLWGLALNAAGSVGGWQHAAGADAGAWLGAVGLADSLLGAVACFLPMLATYQASGGGAGDVKLATAMGALLGLRNGVLALLLSYVIAGAAILAWLVWTVGPWSLARTLGRWLGAAIVPGLLAPPGGIEPGLLKRPVRMGPFYAAGGLLTLGGAFGA